MKFILSFLLLFDPRRFRSKRWPIALMLAVLGTVGSGLVVHPYSQMVELSPDGHMVLSVEEAVNKALCGVGFSIWQAPDRAISPSGEKSQPLRELLTAANLNQIPLKTVVETRSRPLPEYCQTMFTFKNNENALYFIYSAVLSIFPEASVIDLFRVVTTLRMAILAFIAFVSLMLGMGYIFVVVSIVLGMQLHLLVSADHPLSIYPFMTTQLVAFVCLVAMLYIFLCRGESAIWRYFLAGASTAVAIVLILNMRTSHGMMAIVGALWVAVLLALRGQELSVGLNRWAAAGIIIFGAVVSGFTAQYLLLKNLPETGYNYTYHPIAHPLVLGLADPQNAFAERRGIKWDDSAGLALARQVDPSATYLGPTYERSLYLYYLGLWKNFPSEMMSIYARKFDVTGTSIPGWIHHIIGTLATLVLWPVMPLLKSGWIWLSVQVLMILVGAALFLKRGTMQYLSLSLFGTIGALLISENAIISPKFDLVHFSSMAEWGLLTGLLIYQWLTNAIFAAVRPIRQSPRGQAPSCQSPVEP